MFSDITENSNLLYSQFYYFNPKCQFLLLKLCSCLLWWVFREELMLKIFWSINTLVHVRNGCTAMKHLAWDLNTFSVATTATSHPKPHETTQKLPGTTCNWCETIHTQFKICRYYQHYPKSVKEKLVMTFWIFKVS